MISSVISGDAVHPRVCGEQGGPVLVVPGQYRFIPACAGNSNCLRFLPKKKPGSSPRVRGTVIRYGDRTHYIRFIPACAGNSAHYNKPRPGKPVHPRVCGEQRSSIRGPTMLFGSSPRVRGTVRISKFLVVIRRFIPACAGNSPLSLAGLLLRAVHPRVCGEQAIRGTIAAASAGSSPRVRGTGRLRGLNHRRARFIPACAGNRATSARISSRVPVHPRVCGEQ